MGQNHEHEPLRIAMFTEAYPPIISGVAMATRTLVTELRALGHQVDLYAPRHPEQSGTETGTKRLPSASLPLPGWIPLSLPLTPSRFRRIVDRPYDVVHTQHPFLLGRVARALARQQHVPLLASVHTQYEQYVHYWTPWHKPGCWIVRRLIRAFCNRCDHVVTVAEGMVPLLRGYGVVRPIEVIPNDLDLEAFLCADGTGVRAELGMKESETFLLSVGRLAAEKNLLFLLDAVAPLLATLPARLVFVGDGPLRTELERRVAQTRLHERVRFVGALPHDQTGRFYAAADLFLMPSVTEVNPLTIGESLAAGTPVVAVDSFSARETIAHGQDGLIVPGDASALRNALEQLIARPEARRQMGIRAKNSIRTRSGQSAAVRTVALYRRLADQKHQPRPYQTTVQQHLS